MKILVYGAGVLGSLYAAGLQEAGHDVTILARGQRLVDLHQFGLVLEAESTGFRRSVDVGIIYQLLPEDAFDFVLVVVRKNQLPSVLPALAANRNTPNVLFLLNNAAGPQALIDSLGAERVLLGFPGAGGARAGHVIRYSLVSAGVQPTTIGELNGQVTPRLQAIAHALGSAGFPVAISPNMDAWLKTHVAIVSPIANALYMVGGDNYRLAHTRDGLVILARAMREGLRVLQALHIPIQPPKLRLLQWIPEPLMVVLLRRILDTQRAELVMARHANAARDEMQTLADEFNTLVKSSGISTPNIDRLRLYLDPTYPTAPAGSAGLPLNWRSTWAALGALGGILLAAGLFWRRPRRQKNKS